MPPSVKICTFLVEIICGDTDRPTDPVSSGLSYKMKVQFQSDGLFTSRSYHLKYGSLWVINNTLQGAPCISYCF